ncbi:TRAP transporter small permease [Halomonas aquamarina]|uniref:TRAP transporter small permease n=1 Tax=Vreelandella aquamarina TaxID=77097 RepID=A0ACC5VSB8_9GAMM|nr:TRAP transporter small permease [Halomonas aquamarina]MBZ5486552.1 TRAP transporter small permease [Halomonas aquamarina]
MSQPPSLQDVASDTPGMRIVRRAAALLENLIAALVAAIFLLCFTLVVLRYLFGIGFAGAEELMRFLFVYSTALGASVAILRGEHIRIGVFVERLPPACLKAVDSLRHLLVVLFNAYLAWLSLGWIGQVGRFRSAVLDVPNWVVQISVPVGAVLVILFSLAVLVGGERPATRRDDAQEAQA